MRSRRQQIALIAHDNKKADLVEWARFNRDTLAEHDLSATGTTGALIEAELRLPVLKYESGPRGGDQQVGAAIVEGRVDLVVFFWDPLEPHPHDVDVKALLRIAVVYDVPIACNRSSADFLISSPLFNRGRARGRSSGRGCLMAAAGRRERVSEAGELLAAFEAVEAQRIACALLTKHCEAALFELRCSLGQARDPSEVRCGLHAADVLESVLMEWRTALRLLEGGRPAARGVPGDVFTPRSRPLTPH
jgi:methylglyoxal synthase